jgi:hypothetical protein
VSRTTELLGKMPLLTTGWIGSKCVPRFH